MPPCHGGRLIQTFGDPAGIRQASLVKPSRAARNYVYFGGGTITFGKLTMRDADLQLIDADPRDPFDFFPARYDSQLVAGYSKNTRAKGLRTYMPDFDDLATPLDDGERPAEAERSRRRWNTRTPARLARHSPVMGTIHSAGRRIVGALGAVPRGDREVAAGQASVDAIGTSRTRLADGSTFTSIKLWKNGATL